MPTPPPPPSPEYSVPGLGLLLAGSFLLPCLARLCRTIHKRRPATKTRAALPHQDLIEISSGPRAVSQAEDQAITAELVREGGSGIEEQDRRLHSPPNVHHDSGVQPESASVALARAWKEVSITLCALGMLFTALARYPISTAHPHDGGPDGLLMPIILWGSVSVMSATRLLIRIRSEILQRARPGPAYFALEYRCLALFLISLPLELLDTRRLLLQHLSGHQHAGTGPTRQLVAIRVSSVLFLVAANLLELVTPRPTTHRAPIVPADRPEHGGKRPGPLEPGCSFLSLAFFIHTDPYLWRHRSSTPTEGSIPDLRADDKAGAVLFRWKKEQDGSQAGPPLGPTLLWHFRHILWSQQLFAYCNALGSLLPPFFLQRILRFVASKSDENAQPGHVALMYACGMLATQLFLAFSLSASLMTGRRLSLRLRALLTTLIFTKSLRRTGATPKAPDAHRGEEEPSTGKKSSPKESASTGKIANLVSNDVASLAEIGSHLHFLWPESPIQLILAGIYLYILLGYSALVGMFCIVIAVPVQSYFTAVWARYQAMLMAAADKRLGLATEVINNIKVVKFFAWESNFLRKMHALREAELALLFKRLLVTVGESAVSFSVPIIVSMVTFYTHTKVFGKSLSAEEAFTALALFNVFKFPLSVLVFTISGVLQSYVSLKRIESFLNEEETEKDATFTYAANKKDAGSTIESSTFRLSGLDFAFPEGKLSLIIGRGKGKSTLLLSLLGETTKLSGEAFLPCPVSRAWGLDPDAQLSDTTAYCPQQPWLLSDSIRNNILYGSSMNRSRYTQVLKACALAPDLRPFTDGDLTEIGDKGTVLSGGQKARISLARALYSPAKVLLLDDVLSAVDSHTAQHLFNHALNGPLMNERTCILVTHAVDLCMPAASFVVSLDRGQVAHAGDPSLSKLASALVTTSENTEVENKKSAPEVRPELTIENLAAPMLNEEDAVVEIKTRATQRLVKEEHQAVGAVSLTTYRLYYDCLGGLMPLFITFVLFILAELGNVLSTWVLKQWAGSNQTSPAPSSPMSSSLLNLSSVATSTKISSTSSELLTSDSSSLEDPTREARLDRYILLYLLTGIFALAFELMRETYFTRRSIIAGRKIYERLIGTLLNAQVRFFDTVPMGRILNRLSTDVRTVDQDLSNVLIHLAEDVLGTIAILIVVVGVLPTGFLVFAVGTSLIYVAIGYLYLASTRELKRFESTSRSPVISLCTECLGGVTSIRAYGDIGRYTQQMFQLIDAYNRPFFMLWMCNRWLSCRIDTAVALFTFLVVIYIIQSDMPAALSGFALSYVITLNKKTLWIVRWWGVNEINFNSMERIHEYLRVEQEPKNGIQPPAAWPSKQGTVEVEGLTARYAPHLPPVLKSVSFSIKAGEKIGICGRTGSGKSTLALSFFRFIEAEAGRIIIDGLDISKLDLASLRSRMTIIPQESVLFSATIRWNLDPFSEHDDTQIWDALRRVGMAASSSELPLNGSNAANAPPDASSSAHDVQFITSLNMEVKEGGKNFSTGQRQLLAIARAILKLENSALLILDESTASLDAESDEKIQAAIRTEMGNSTILCIAHRLKTIIDYDKVLVLSDGEVLEFDEPWRLLLDDEGGEGEVTKPSAFKELCLKSGHYDELKQSALQLRAKNLRST
ncbi:hypothetical protein PTTG_07447 [Puccinia triticina 1-1 BBBD Race 1]|uniref:Uncharacterized protein n=2 Tax=Puccinia triticina TaxID=208348 RepID=A0A180GBJ4_PUCT1|nr:uncharacterized protein PtA15_17A277 [Puccinia triticina]OAV90001.1 hypothetical protein PTTG_07447 [Puccinia triticina 1-1 BBBD Race 1]WAQ92795.1 hypothetical protein PtA15_17A277 [Puccinia triticina]WAR63699.1 hypothetical protein PtB15_17B300 [Puccinia triticina]